MVRGPMGAADGLIAFEVGQGFGEAQVAGGGVVHTLSVRSGFCLGEGGGFFLGEGVFVGALKQGRVGAGERPVLEQHFLEFGGALGLRLRFLGC